MQRYKDPRKLTMWNLNFLSDQANRNTTIVAADRAIREYLDHQKVGKKKKSMKDEMDELD